jgi:hypothetical protein
MAVWLMNGTTVTIGQVIYSGVPLNWKIAGTVDFNKDGNIDILWRNTINGDVAVWFMDGLNVTIGQVISQGADFNWQIMNK